MSGTVFRQTLLLDCFFNKGPNPNNLETNDFLVCEIVRDAKF